MLLNNGNPYTGCFDIKMYDSGGVELTHSTVRPAGFVAIASGSLNSTVLPANAFDDNESTSNWLAPATTGWIGCDFGSGTTRAVKTFSIVGVGNMLSVTNQTFQSFNLEYSSDAISWNVLKSYTGYTTWAVGEVKSFTT